LTTIGDINIIGKNIIRMTGFNRTTIFSLSRLDQTLSSPSCVSLVVFTNTSGTFHVQGLYNSSNNTCTFMEERFLLSNTSNIHGYTLMFSGILKRHCTKFCTPFYEYFTKDIDVNRLAVNGFATRTAVSLSGSEYLSVVSFAQHQGPGNFSFGGLNFSTNTENFTLDSFSYVNISGDEGKVTMAAPNGLLVTGDILDSNGDTHPCCSGVQDPSPTSLLSRIKKITFTSNKTNTFTAGEVAFDFSSMSSTNLGSLTKVSFFQSNSSFLLGSGNGGFYEMTMSIKLDKTKFSIANITQIGCLFLNLDPDGSVINYYTTDMTTSFQTRDNSIYTLTCKTMTTFLNSLGESVQIKLLTLNPSSGTFGSSSNLTAVVGSFVQMVEL